MTANILKPLNQIASFLKVQSGKITLNEDSLPVRAANKDSSCGFINIILTLIKESNSDLGGSNLIEKSEVRQWIEYALIYVLKEDSSSISQVLRELNAILHTCTYLVGQRLTVADIFIYYVLQAIMENLSHLDKEKYVHLSRWFDNMQQNPAIRQSNKIIDFSTLYLASIAPARH